MSVFKDLSSWWDRLRGKGPAAVVALTVDLGSARADQLVSVDAGGLVVERCDGDLYAKINGPNGDGVNLRYTRAIAYPVVSLYLTNLEQAGLSAKLLILPEGMTAHAQVEIRVSGAYLAPTALAAGGTATIWTPASRRLVRLKRLSLSCDAATRLDLRWATTAWQSHYLPANGNIIINLVGSNEHGAPDQALTLLSSAAATVTARASGEEVV